MAYNAKTNWAIDNVVLPADMNRIEQGIKDVDTGKAPLSHTHTIANITGLQSALDGKASSSHSHSISNITGLQNALDAKASASHIHVPATSTSNGFMSSSDKVKLDGISNKATETYVTDGLSSTSSTIALSANQGRLLKGMIDAKAPSNHTHTNATTSSAGFMSTNDKSKLDGIAANANRTLVTDSLTSTSTTSALSANQGKVLNDNLDNLLVQMGDKLSKPGTTQLDQLNLGYNPGVHAKGAEVSDNPMLRFYSATGDVLGLIYADSSVTSLRSWSGTGGDVEVRAMGSTKNVNIQAGTDGYINLNTTNDANVRVNGSSVALKSDLPNALDNISNAKLGKYPRVQGNSDTGGSYFSFYNNGSTRLGNIGYFSVSDSPLGISDSIGKGIEFSTAGYFKVKRGGDTSYADVAIVKVGTYVPSASSLKDGDIYIQY